MDNIQMTQINQKKINETIINLKNSPIYAMSLGSHELFHSNFWKWLIEHNNIYGKVFFNELEPILNVRREQKSRDLTIWTGKDKSAFVVENKLKSLPSENQLIEYQKNLKSQFAAGCLTGIIDLPSMPEGWKFLNYKEIGKGIIEIANVHEIESFKKELILEYGKTIILLYDILIRLADNFSDRLMSSRDVPKEIQDIRLDDIIKKMNADKFAKYLQAIKPDLEKLVNEYNIETIIQSWYSNKSSVIDVRFIKNKDTPYQVLMGVQIQNGQYRLCAERKTKTIYTDNQKYCNVVFEEFKTLGWFFDYNQDKKISDKPTSMSKSFNKYEQKNGSENDYHFVYQYWNIDDSAFDAIIKHIHKDMEKAAGIIKNID